MTHKTRIRIAAAVTCLFLAGLTAADGFHPSTQGHREIARAFARVLRRAAG